MRKFALLALVLTIISSPANAQMVNPVISGPDWPSASCDYDGQRFDVNAYHQRNNATDEIGPKHVTTYMSRNGETGVLSIRWYPDTEVELLCGKYSIIVVASGTTIIEIMLPPDPQHN